MLSRSVTVVLICCGDAMIVILSVSGFQEGVNHDLSEYEIGREEKGENKIVRDAH